MSETRFLAVAVLLLGVAGVALAGEAPMAVSPGDASKLALIDDRCPTFSWGVVKAARSYELVAYRVGAGGGAEAVEPVLTQAFHGAVSNWTPSLDSCLARGGKYAWSVRAMLRKGPTEWSTPSLFEIALAQTEIELEDALEVVRRHLASEGLTDQVSVESEGTAVNGSTRDVSSFSVASGQGMLSDAATVREARPGGSPESAAPALTSLVTEGAVGVGVEAPLADLHVVGAPTLATVLVAPSEPASQQDSELILAEDDDGTYAMKLRYDGSTNMLQIWGKSVSGNLGPWLEIQRDSGRMKGAKWNPDPPCFNTTQRFVDCGNGTVTDTLAGLIYLKNANCFGTQDWPTANLSAAGLAHGACNLTDGSRAGDWRLPTREEWEGIVAAGCSTAPKIGGNGNSGCYSQEAWASGVQSASYWSSTTYEFSTPYQYAHKVLLDDGTTHNVDYKTTSFHVWPVRDAQ